MSSFEHRSIAQIRSNPNYKYIDLTVRSFQESPDVTQRQLRFHDQRDSNIVNNARDYKMSVVRFQMDSFQLPLLFFQVARNQADPNQGAYTVTLEYDDGAGLITSTVPFPVMWIAQNAYLPVPGPPSSNNLGVQQIDPYYWCYSYEHMLRLTNTALFDAMVALKALVPALLTVEEPFLAWQSDSQKARLYARESHFDTAVFPQVRIYFNRPLYALFNSFSWVNFAGTRANNQQHLLNVNSYNGANISTLIHFGIDKLIFCDQDVSTIANWSPVSSILFTSATIPIEPNDLSNPTIFIDGNQYNSGSTYSLSDNIITDMSTDQDSYRSNLLYLPQGENRWISLRNDMPIREIDISVYWRDYLGITRPYYMPPGASCSIKILFQKIKLD
jgi:hypothetical protein